MKILRLFLICFALPLAAEELLCINDARQAEFSGSSKIVFTRHSTGKAAFYDINNRKVTELDFSGNSFSSRHDGTLFCCGDGIFPQLFLLDANTGKTTEITVSEPPSGVVFKVDSSTWAFPCGYEKIPKLLFIDGRSLKERQPLVLPPGTVDVSCNGKYAAIQFDNGTCNIRIVEIATGKTLFVTEAISGSMQKNGCHSPVFSPDGTKVLYVTGDIQPLADIMMYDIEKRQLKRMTSDGKDNQRPRWSSDGKRYIHTTLRNGKYCTAVKTL